MFVALLPYRHMFVVLLCVGQDDVDSWIAKWEDRLNKDAADVMAAARCVCDIHIHIALYECVCIYIYG
jgi:hypothetical protein